MKQAYYRTKKKVLAIASGGGHWVQLMRVAPAFVGHDVAFVTVDPTYRVDVAQYDGADFRVVNDATRWSKVGLAKLALRMAYIVARERPDVVISTGAAPGYFGMLFGKLFGARTVWLDSIANVERLSMSGERIRRHADLWLTQWPHLAREEGPHFVGAVL